MVHYQVRINVFHQRHYSLVKDAYNTHNNFSIINNNCCVSFFSLLKSGVPMIINGSFGILSIIRASSFHNLSKNDPSELSLPVDILIIQVLDLQ